MQPSSSALLILIFTLFLSTLHIKPVHTSTTVPTCRTLCGSGININYPFGVDDGCGASQYRKMLNCSGDSLFFLTPSGSYRVKSIDYQKQTMTIFDPSMSTCTTLQPHHDFILSEIQSVIIPPTSDTIFALLNCSIDSPVLNHYRSVCFNFSGHSCDELYSSCTSFKIFHVGPVGNPIGNPVGPIPIGNPGGNPVGNPIGIPVGSNPIGTPVGNTIGNPIGIPVGSNPIGTPGGNPVGNPIGIPVGSNSVGTPVGSSGGYPPCCFTGYSTVKLMSMNILDCSHYTSVYDTDGLKGVGPNDWAYGLKLAYTVPNTGCDRCQRSGGTCGYDTETEMMLCFCSGSSNSTRECAGGVSDGGREITPLKFFQLLVLALGAFVNVFP